MNERFLIFRNGSIGNTLVAVPAIKALREAYPDAFIAIVVDTIGSELLKYCPYADELYVYEKKGQHKSLWANFKFLWRLRRKKFTKAILFKRFFRNGFLSFLAGIPERIGYETHGKAPFLTQTIPYVEGRNIVELNLDLVKSIGIEAKDNRLELWAGEDEKQKVDNFLKEHGVSGKAIKIVFHVGGITAKNQSWPLKNYAALADRLMGAFSATAILLAPEGEHPEVQRAAELMERDPIVALEFSVLETAELIRRCQLFIGSDSGPSHMADAVGTPGVIFYPSRPDMRKWKPLSEKYVALIVNDSIEEGFAACEQILALRSRA